MPEPETLDALRDTLAGHFCAETVKRLPTVCQRIAERLAAEQEREKWRPLREASQFLGSVQAELAASLQRKVCERFDAKARPEDDALGKTQRFSLASLSLVEDSVMQEEIAITNASRMLVERLRRDLAPLTSRLEELLQVKQLHDDHNPAFPRIFCRALFESLEETGADGAVRMAIFQAFEPDLAAAVRAVYAAAAGGAAISPAPAEALAKPGAAAKPGSEAAEAVVARAFDALAADPRIAPPVRGQVEGLRKAAARAARTNPALLADPSHAVVRLTDLVCAFGLPGGVAGAEALLAAALGPLVAGASEVRAFEAAWQSLEASFSRAQGIATRSHPLMAGETPAMSREAAIAAATNEIRQRIAADPRATGGAAAGFVERAWAPVLARDLVELGPGSANWNTDLSTLDYLLWSLGPKAPDELRQMLAQLPVLVQRLREGFSRAGLDAAAAEGLLDEMKQMHTQVLREHLPANRRRSPVLSGTIEPRAPVPCGAWLELRNATVARRFRVNAVRLTHGDCLLRDLEHDRWMPIRHAILARGLQTQAARIVPGPGIASAALEAAGASPQARALT